jgi:hypothetical protein
MIFPRSRKDLEANALRLLQMPSSSAIAIRAHTGRAVFERSALTNLALVAVFCRHL